MRVLNKLLAVSAMSMALISSASAEENIKVGVSVSSTGAFALASQSGERGLGLWVDDVNSRGGIDLGDGPRLVELVKLDARSDKQQVARVYETLIEENDVDVLVAPFGSTLTGAAATVTERLDKFMVIWSAASEAVYSQGFSRIVSATQMPVSIMPQASIQAGATLGAKKIAIIYVDEPFPAGLAAAAEQLAQENGMEVVMMEKFAKGTKDFSTMIEKARALGADAFYPSAYEGDQISMLQQMEELDASFPYTFMVYGSTPQFLEVGDSTNYIFSHTNFHPSVNWDVTSGLNRAEFLESYDRLYADVDFGPDFQTALAYGAGAILEEVIEKAGSTDASALKAAALELSGDVTVLAGPYEIDEAGRQLGMPFVVVQNQGDNVAAVFPPDAASAEAVFPIPTWAERN
jgi:branched-chain amino acid transport system substrate-binding protein